MKWPLHVKIIHARVSAYLSWMTFTMFTVCDCAGEEEPAEDFQAALEAELANPTPMAEDSAAVASPAASQRTAAKSGPGPSRKKRDQNEKMICSLNGRKWHKQEGL